MGVERGRLLSRYTVIGTLEQVGGVHDKIIGYLGARVGWVGH